VRQPHKVTVPSFASPAQRGQSNFKQWFPAFSKVPNQASWACQKKSAQELHKHDAGGEMTDAVKIVNETMQRQKI